MAHDEKILKFIEGQEFEMMSVFPQTIGIAKADKETAIKNVDTIHKYIDEGDFPDGFIYHTLHDIPEFESLNTWVDEQVNKYTQELKFPDKYVCTESWIHDYNIYSHQPWHAHAGNVISAVYIAWGRPYTDSNLYFKNPVGEDMMNPYNITPNSDQNKFGEMFTEWTYPQWSFPSVPGCLYIFRSYMEHMVQLKKNTDRRTVLAYNYNKESNNK